MKLFKLSLKNIRKSIKDYAIYFCTLILGVAIFYVFNAIESQTVLLNVTASTKEIIDLMVGMLSGVSVFVAFVLGFLIIYANQFLMKRRNKEFALYLLLGMGKRKLSMVLFFETVFIGIISLIIGLVLGTFLSQIMSVVVANMFEADMTDFTFIFSGSACIKTVSYFGIMYAIVMIFNTLTVNKCKLIDLLQSGKRSEKVRLKNPLLCIIVFIISACGLGYAYYLVTVGATTLTYASDILFLIGIGIVTTFFIFWSLSGLILFIVMKMKGVYFKGLNSFTFRQVSSKINTTVVSMTTICIMLFLTICILASALSINNSMTANLKMLAPVDIELYKTRNISDEKGQQLGYSSEQIEDSYISIEESLEKLDIHVNDYFTDMVKTFMYTSNEVTFETTLGSKIEQIKERFPLVSYSTPEEIMKISDYNKIASLYGNETYTLEDNEYMIVADYDSMVEIRDEALQAEEPITFDNQTFYPKYKECKNGFVDISSNHINVGIILVPDHAVTEEMVERELLIGSVTKVEMKDDYSKVEISKTDITTGEELEGAKLQILNKDGEILEEWVTDGKPHLVEKLPVGEELTLREITAPEGYEIAEDVKFTLEDTMEIQKVEMKDARTPETPGVPQTGDDHWKPILLFGLLGASAAGFLVTMIYKKKRGKTEKADETKKEE